MTALEKIFSFRVKRPNSVHFDCFSLFYAVKQLDFSSSSNSQQLCLVDSRCTVAVNLEITSIELYLHKHDILPFFLKLLEVLPEKQRNSFWLLTRD